MKQDPAAIDERTRLEETVRVTEARLRVALQACPIVVFNQDTELRYTWIHNPRLLTIAQVLGKTDLELLPPGDAERITALKTRVLTTGIGVREVVRIASDPEPTYHDLTVEQLKDPAGRVLGITCASWDVTDQRRLELEQRFLAEAGGLLIGVSDYESALLELARLVVGGGADWFIVDVVEGQEVRRLKIECSRPDMHALAAAFEGPLDGRPDITLDARTKLRTRLVTDVDRAFLESIAQSPEHLTVLGKLDVRSCITVPLVINDRLLGAFGFLSSKRRYGDQALRMAEELARIAAIAINNAKLQESTQRAIAARDEIVGMVAHDLRSPLSNIRLLSELLRMPNGSRSEFTIDAINRAAVRMDRLIQDMLDVTTLDGGIATSLRVDPVPVSTRPLLAEVLETQRGLAASLDLQVQLEICEELPDVFADRDRLLQVFENIIGNAVKFTKAGGTIVIGATALDDAMRFQVTDNGEGISSDHLPHLFERFWQATKSDRRGTGLGLAIVKGIIEAHHGKVWFESVIGIGTTVYFTVPFARD